jgi:hypothetical protein
MAHAWWPIACTIGLLLQIADEHEGRPVIGVRMSVDPTTSPATLPVGDAGQKTSAQTKANCPKTRKKSRKTAACRGRLTAVAGLEL